MRSYQRKARQNAPEPPLGEPARSFLPTRWVLGPDAWEAGAVELLALPQPLGLVGEAGLLKTFRKPLTEAWLQAGVALELLAQADGSDCRQVSVDALLQQGRLRGVKSLLGFGGGRMLDLAKAAGYAASWPVATAPTSPATSACGTAVAVLNDEEGAFSQVLDLSEAPRISLLDEEALSSAPPRLLSAGFADTLAKWLEWGALESEPVQPAVAEAWALAQKAARVCESRGLEALRGDWEAKKACWEACLVHSSQISWAGQAPAAAAHSLANALTRQGVGRGLLHGEAVGLGLLWQESLLTPLGRAKMGEGPLRALLHSWNLPIKLPEGLNLRSLVRDALRKDETVHLLEIDLGEEAALAALPTTA